MMKIVHSCECSEAKCIQNSGTPGRIIESKELDEGLFVKESPEKAYINETINECRANMEKNHVLSKHSIKLIELDLF